jgi:hypothetical protein
LTNTQAEHRLVLTMVATIHWLTKLSAAEQDAVWRDLDSRLAEARRRDEALGILWRCSANDDLDEAFDELADEYVALVRAFASTPATTPFAREVKSNLKTMEYDGVRHRGFWDRSFGHRPLERWDPAAKVWRRC